MKNYTKFIQVLEHPGQPVTRVVVMTDAVILPDILEAFEDFLRGSGFSFTGKIEIVEEETVLFPKNEYQEKSVVQAIADLQVALEENYARSKMSISLEPDAFHRLSNEIHQKDGMEPLTEAQYRKESFAIYGPYNEIKIKKDDSLGTDGFVKHMKESKK